jgi:glucose/arabinose dehydrogenase
LRLRRLLIVNLLATAAALCCLAWVAAPAGATPSYTESAFESVPLANGLDLPTDVAWAPDGRMFIAEKEGYVRVVEANGTLLANPIVDIHDHVIPYGDRGLIGIAVAPAEHSTDIRLYLLYDYGQPEATSEEEGLKTIATATLTSVTVEADNKVVGGKTGGPVDPSETTVLGTVDSPGTTYGSACASENIDCIPADGFTHSIGTVIVDPKDGSLWIGSGDGLSDFEAEEGKIASPLHIRAQDPESLAGKILHVKADGSGFPNSPFCTNAADTTSNCSKVYAAGFRNPFRFTLRQLSGNSVPVVGDVGEGHWEELDLLDNRGFNGGWPCYEGNEENPDFTGTATQCTGPTTPFSAPLFVYTHFNDQCTPYPNPPNPCDTNNEPGAAVASAGIYTGKNYPASFEGKLFVADYVNSWISAVDTNSPPAFGYSTGIGMPLFATQLGELVDVVQAPDGNLVYVTLSVNSETALGLGTVQEIRYAPTDKSPVAVPDAASSCIDSNTTSPQVSLIGDDSYDPDGDTSLTYHWDFGDGASSSEANPAHTYAADGNYVARLTVTDSKGNSASGFLAVHIHAGQGGQPAAAIKFPEQSREYIADVGVDLSGENKTAGANSQWQVVKYDGANIAGAMKPIETGTEGSTEFRTDRSPPSTLNYVLHFVSSNGTCTTTVSRTLEPQRGELTLAAQDQAGGRLGVSLTFGSGLSAQAPFQLTVVKNMLAHVAAPQTFTSGSGTYEFQRWSDGGPREHEARLFEYPTHASEETQTLTAIYAPVLPSGGSTSGPPPPSPPPASKPPRVTLNHFKGRPSSLSGTVVDTIAVTSLRLAIRPLHPKGKGCAWWSMKRRRLVPASRSCAHVSWLSARLRTINATTRWTLPLGGRLPPGRYVLVVSALDRAGHEASQIEGLPGDRLNVR